MYEISGESGIIHECETFGDVVKFVNDYLYKKVFYPIRFKKLDSIMEKFIKEFGKTIRSHISKYEFRYIENGKRIVLYISKKE